MRLGAYIKAAFLYHWNLLAFLGGTALALISGRPDVALPLVAAIELTYLGLLGTHTKFQKYVDARDAKRRRESGAVSALQALERIRRALPEDSLARYEALRTRCVELREIGRNLSHADAGPGARPFEKLQLAGLDRLLWIYLRLLYTSHSLERFLDRTSEKSILNDIRRLETQLVRYGPDTTETNPRRQQARAAVEDNLATSRGRLANLEKARENHELVELEIDRLENKIRSLSELAVNRQEPEFISGQVDSVASSMLDTERTMNELEFATGFAQLDETVPELLHRPAVEVERP